MCCLVILSKYTSTKHKTLRAEPFGQRLWGISAALSASHVGQLHIEASALHKIPTNCCKNHHQRSTAPSNLKIQDSARLIGVVIAAFLPRRSQLRQKGTTQSTASVNSPEGRPSIRASSGRFGIFTNHFKSSKCGLSVNIAFGLIALFFLMMCCSLTT